MIPWDWPGQPVAWDWLPLEFGPDSELHEWVEGFQFDIEGLRTYNWTNGRNHWGKRQARTKVEHTGVAWHWPFGRLRNGLEHGTVALVRLTRFGPVRMDDDGAAAALKGVRDAVAARLGVDDGDRNRVRFFYAMERAPFAVRVEVAVFTQHPPPGGADGRTIRTSGLEAPPEDPAEGRRDGRSSAADASDRRVQYARRDRRQRGPDDVLP